MKETSLLKKLEKAIGLYHIGIKAPRRNRGMLYYGGLHFTQEPKEEHCYMTRPRRNNILIGADIDVNMFYESLPQDISPNELRAAVIRVLKKGIKRGKLECAWRRREISKIEREINDIDKILNELHLLYEWICPGRTAHKGDNR